MEDIGDYLYFVVLLIAMISGLLKSKKKKAQEQETYEREPREIDLDEVLQELDPYFEKPAPVVRPEPQKSAPERYQTYESIKDSSALRAKKQVAKTIHSKIKTESIFEEPATVETFQVSINNLDDAKRAFVYSEIFNRKY